jgi:hypothetical protein
VAKPVGKRLLGRHRCRWENSIKMDLRWGGMDWIDLAQLRALVNTVMKFLLHKILGNS